jgi:hypothetical protein
MTIRAILPAEGRNLRLDLSRGIANWEIFLNHIPNNAMTWLTTRNYGFSDAAELFVFIAGYAAGIVYSKSMLAQRFAAGTTRLFERAWQLYIAHVLLLVINLAVINWAAQTYSQPHLLDEFNVAGLINHPVLTLTQGLLLKYRPFNLDILPLYVVLMAGRSASIVADAPTARHYARGLACALFRGPMAWLESSCLSVGRMVFQSFHMAIPLHIGRLVRTRRRLEDVDNHSVTCRPLPRNRIFDFRAVNDDGWSFRGVRKISS